MDWILDYDDAQYYHYRLKTFREATMHQLSTGITDMHGEDELRIVLLGKTGVGKSSVGNTILGEKVFKAKCAIGSETHICQRAERVINGRRIVVIDTPGFFDTDRSEEALKKEIISSLVECAPGPHVFILVLKVERHTEENQKALENFLEYFKGDVLDHVVLLFTHGNDLEENMTIHDFINGSDVDGENCQNLKMLTESCANRVHVLDNKHWSSSVTAVRAEVQKLNISTQTLNQILEMLPRTEPQTNTAPWFSVLSDHADNAEAEYQNQSEEKRRREYKSNQFQLTQLMKSVKNILSENNGQHYRNEALDEIELIINEEINYIQHEMSVERVGGSTVETQPVDPDVIRRRAIKRVRNKLGRQLAGVTVGTLLGALLGVGVGLAAPLVLVAGLIRAGYRKLTQQSPQARGPPVQTADVGAGIAAGAGVVAGVGAEITIATVAEAAVLGAGAATGIGAGVGAGVLLLYGAVKGGVSGYKESKTSDNPGEVAKNVSQAVTQKAGDVLKTCWNLGNTNTGDEAKPLLDKDK